MFLSCLDLKCFFCFLWNLQGGSSVHLWCIKLICTAWGSLAICFICLAVALELSVFFWQAVSLFFRKLVKVNITIINCLWDKFLIPDEKPKDISMHSCGYLANATCICTVAPFINRSFTLSNACEQVKSSSDLIRLGFTELFKFSCITSRVCSSLVNFHDTY